MDASQVKVAWEGEVVSVQPRTTMWRYLVDNRTHREIGYNVFVRTPGLPSRRSGGLPIWSRRFNTRARGSRRRR